MTGPGWVARAVTAALAVVAANLALQLLARRHDVVLVSLAVVCVVALVWLVVDAASVLVPPEWSMAHLVDERPPPREGTLAAYERLLEAHWAGREPDTDLQRRLLAVAEHRVRQVHGLGDADRDVVRARLGPELGALADPAPRRLSPGQVAAIIDRIEEL